MNNKIYQRYLETSIYTYVGPYKEFILSLPDDIPSIGMLVCDQITHPSMYFTEPSSYLEDAYYGKFTSYPKHRFKNEDELYITAVSEPDLWISAIQVTAIWNIGLMSTGIFMH